MSGPFEQAARERKVSALVAALRLAGCDRSALLTEQVRADALGFCGLRSASAETWALVAKSLDAPVLFVPADPFACFPQAGSVAR